MLIYTGIQSLDGYIEDAAGRFDWSAPDPEVHAFINEQSRHVETEIYGRRMFETLQVWETMDDPDPVMQEYAAIWKATRKIVVSRTLDAVTTSNTTLVREVPPIEGVTSIGGAAIAASVIDQIDEFRLFVNPVAVGGGKRFLPEGFSETLHLDDHRVFDSGVVYLSYLTAKGRHRNR